MRTQRGPRLLLSGGSRLRSCASNADWMVTMNGRIGVPGPATVANWEGK